MTTPPPALCPCGSGLRPERCCALHPTAIPSAETTRHLVPLVERAFQAYQQGAKDLAERLCLEVLELAPDRPGALLLLHAIRKEQGKTTAAIDKLDRLDALFPDDPGSILTRAVLLGRTKRHDQALALLDRPIQPPDQTAATPAPPATPRSPNRSTTAHCAVIATIAAT